MLGGIACNPELSLNDVLKGKGCRAVEPYCVQPYVCDQRKICVMPGELVEAGDSSGSVSDDLSPAAGGTAPLAASTMDDPAVGGAGGAAGSGLSAAGAGGVSSDPPAGAADAGCIKQQLFLDRDGDGYGSNAPEDTKFDCPTAGWVEVGGDCFDAMPTAENKAAQVHPEQAMFFSTGYPLPGGQAGEVSFDYDCSLQEEGDPNNDPNLGPAGDCSSLTSDCLSAIGVLPTTRSGPSVNSLCGSTLEQVCFPEQPNQCALGPSRTIAPVRCH
jgi:hypothetical protein